MSLILCTCQLPPPWRGCAACSRSLTTGLLTTHALQSVMTVRGALRRSTRREHRRPSTHVTHTKVWLNYKYRCKFGATCDILRICRTYFKLHWRKIENSREQSSLLNSIWLHIFASTGTSEKSARVLTRSGHYCIFPFFHKRRQFTSCTTYELATYQSTNNLPQEALAHLPKIQAPGAWCAVAVDFEGVATMKSECLGSFEVGRQSSK